MSGYRTLLPPAEELLRQKQKPGTTYDKIGERYGTSRQAVHKRIKKYLQQQADTEAVSS